MGSLHPFRLGVCPSALPHALNPMVVWRQLILPQATSLLVPLSALERTYRTSSQVLGRATSLPRHLVSVNFLSLLPSPIPGFLGLL